jgi:hypothetical protein
MKRTVKQYFMSPDELLESLNVIKPTGEMNGFDTSSPSPTTENNLTEVIVGIVALIAIGYLAIKVYESYAEKEKKPNIIL